MGCQVLFRSIENWLDPERHVNYDRSSLTDIERKVRVLAREISRRSYALKCFELAERFCRKNQKSDIEFVARGMVTALTNYGVNQRQISQTVINTFFRTKKVDGTSALKPFFREIFPHHHNFSVLFTYDTPIEALPESVLRLFRLESANAVPKDFKGKKGVGKVPKLKSADCYLIASNISATDKFSAVDQAKQKIQRVHDIFGIYHHKLEYYCDEKAFTLQ
ncbi:hypothetical protein Q5Y75_23990 [Ruegeria sp. 2205SS24-7]|uniref:hypothetical protein n=1 Tax=Ruegeria discodermiae TaxID=3064389 RepID=UPI0027411C13|nr:hypothetical protein [Ruegeria sp. 2205SS24-7]MDP5220256.1 hypothetical protein [Ruegeria sp. 2205SS24-7]